MTLIQIQKYKIKLIDEQIKQKKFPIIEFNEEDANRSKRQAIEEYLRDVRDNAKEYNSAWSLQF